MREETFRGETARATVRNAKLTAVAPPSQTAPRELTPVKLKPPLDRQGRPLRLTR